MELCHSGLSWPLPWELRSVTCLLSENWHCQQSAPSCASIFMPILFGVSLSVAQADASCFLGIVCPRVHHPQPLHVSVPLSDVEFSLLSFVLFLDSRIMPVSLTKRSRRSRLPARRGRCSSSRIQLPFVHPISAAPSRSRLREMLCCRKIPNLVSAVHAYTSALRDFQIMGTPDVASAQETLEIIIRDMQRSKGEQ